MIIGKLRRVILTINSNSDTVTRYSRRRYGNSSSGSLNFGYPKLRTPGIHREVIGNWNSSRRELHNSTIQCSGKEEEGGGERNKPEGGPTRTLYETEGLHHEPLRFSTEKEYSLLDKVKALNQTSKPSDTLLETGQFETDNSHEPLPSIPSKEIDTLINEHNNLTTPSEQPSSTFDNHREVRTNSTTQNNIQPSSNCIRIDQSGFYHFVPNHQLDLRNNVNSNEVMTLINQGSIPEACDKIVWLISGYPEYQLPQGHLAMLLYELMKHQGRAPFGYSDNILLMLLDRQFLNMDTCRHFATREEILAALDCMTENPDSFLHWSDFDLKTQVYFSLVLKHRPRSVATSLIQKFLQQMPQDNLPDAYNVAILSYLTSFSPMAYDEDGFKLLEEAIEKKFPLDPKACHSAVSRMLDLAGHEDLEGKTVSRVMRIYRSAQTLAPFLTKETYHALLRLIDAASNHSNNVLLLWNLIEVFHDMLRRKMTPSRTLYNVALKAYSRLAGDSTKPKPSLRNLPELDGRDSEFLNRSSHTDEPWHLRHMREIWDSMQINGVSPDTFTLNAFLGYFASWSSIKNPKASSSLTSCYESLLRHGAIPDRISLNYLLLFYGRRGELKNMDATVTKLMEFGVNPDTHILSTLIQYHTTNNSPHGAIKWFDDLTKPSEFNRNGEIPLVPSDETICSIMVSVAEQLKDLSLMDHFWQLCCHPPNRPPSKDLHVTIFHRVINSYAKLIRVSSASLYKNEIKGKDILWRIKMILQRMQQSELIRVDQQIYNVAIKAYTSYMLCPDGRKAPLESYKGAKEVYQAMMNDTRVKPDHLTYATLLNALAVSMGQQQRPSPQLVAESETLQYDMRRLNITPNSYVSATLIKIASNCGNATQLNTVFEQFLKSADRPDFGHQPEQLVPVYNAYLSFRGHTDFSIFPNIIKDMVRRKAYPDALTYRIWLRGLHRLRAPINLFWEALDHMTIPGKGPRAAIDTNFAMMVGELFCGRGGPLAMQRAIDILLHYHDRKIATPSLFAHLLRLTIHPQQFTGRYTQDPLIIASHWFRALLDFPSSAIHRALAREVVTSLEATFLHHRDFWDDQPILKEELQTFRRQHLPDDAASSPSSPPSLSSKL